MYLKKINWYIVYIDFYEMMAVSSYIWCIFTLKTYTNDTLYLTHS